MRTVKNIMNHIFIDGLSGMALGLFSTLIMGTIIQQIGTLVGGDIGNTIYAIGKVAASMMSAGIGVGVAVKYRESVLVTLSAATAGMIGGYATSLLAGTLVVDGALNYVGVGEPLGAFIAALVGITCGHLVAGKTNVDLIVAPIVTIGTGAVAGLFIGPSISSFMKSLGALVNWGTEQQPFIMGIVVAVLMGMFLTMPISSAAIGIVLDLSGLAAGAATIGCCCNMVGFAVASYRENRFSGFLAQGIGTSMLQVPNIVRRPIIWLPPIIASAILGPIGTVVLEMKNSAAGSGMGTAGLVGQITTWQTMSGSVPDQTLLIQIIAMHIVLPAMITLFISEGFRKAKWIRYGDMKLEL
ncbi:MAG: PTS sugar transporter subunit IIC [Eubacteriales bacterium]